MNSRIGRLILVCTCASSSVAVAADPNDPVIRNAVDRAVGWMKSSTGNRDGGYDSLCGYAMLKGGLEKTDPAIDAVRRKVLARFSTGGYRPSSHHAYEAGCDLMFLEALDAEKYKPHMQLAVNYLRSTQLSTGGWHYPSGNGYGDQSITQYAALGMWAAKRAECDVPPGLWDALAAWEIKAQSRSDGGFGYHPDGSGSASGTPTMTCAGVANLHLARLYLYGAKRPAPQEEPKPEAEPKRFGVLQKIEAKELATTAPDEPEKEEPKDYVPRTPKSTINRSIDSGGGWFRVRFRVLSRGVDDHPYYYWYGLERMASLEDVEEIADVDWYDAGANYLLARQKGNGQIGEAVEHTAFAILFLQNTTRELLGEKPKRGLAVGAGLLAGGRGMPEDLSKVVAVRDGEAEVRTSSDPLDELLSALGDPSSGDTVAAQAALVEKIRLGDREELLARADTVLELVRHPSWEVRRTAIWALGRIERLEHAPLLVAALEDENVDVAIEARNALCYLSRKPLGLGAANGPFDELPENATEEKKAEVAGRWQKDVHARWSEWLSRKAPYESRDRIPRGLRIRAGGR